MLAIRFAAAAMGALIASYAWAAPVANRPVPDDLLGQAMVTVKGPVSGHSALPAGLPDEAGGRFAFALSKVAPDAKAATRGALEMKVYNAAAPAVVLVVTDDAIGSGVLVSADGKIVTNLHVVGKADAVGVIFKPRDANADPYSADVHKAKVLRRDEVADLALIQVSEVPSGITPLKIGNSSEAPVGADVHAIGHPTGETWTYTRGIVSQVRKDYSWKAEDKIEHTATVIQTQTPINPGNSGGPLLDDNLDVVGINSFVGEGEGLNFAVSGEDVAAFLARTSDRTVEAAAPDKTKEACEPVALREERSNERKHKGVYSAIDEDCDGKADFVFFEPDDRRQPEEYIMDTDGDGKIDATIFDTDRDGYPDIAFYDTDGDGKPDMEGEYRNKETKPYLVQKLDGDGNLTR